MNITSSGHYICYIRLSDDSWVKCDDGSITPVRPKGYTLKHVLEHFPFCVRELGNSAGSSTLHRICWWYGWLYARVRALDDV